MAVPRHQEIAVLASQDVHEVVRRLRLTLQQVLEQDAPEGVVIYPVSVYEGNNLHLQHHSVIFARGMSRREESYHDSKPTEPG